MNSKYDKIQYTIKKYVCTIIIRWCSGKTSYVNVYINMYVHGKLLTNVNLVRQLRIAESRRCPSRSLSKRTSNCRVLASGLPKISLRTTECT